MKPAALRDYTLGRRSQVAVAAELGISVRQLQRIEDVALAVWLLAIARAMRDAIDDREDVPQIPRRFACRISESRPEHVEHASRAASSVSAGLQGPVSSGDEHARLLPRRFRSKP